MTHFIVGFILLNIAIVILGLIGASIMWVFKTVTGRQ